MYSTPLPKHTTGYGRGLYPEAKRSWVLAVILVPLLCVVVVAMGHAAFATAHGLDLLHRDWDYRVDAPYFAAMVSAVTVAIIACIALGVGLSAPQVIRTPPTPSGSFDGAAMRRVGGICCLLMPRKIFV